jgi:hypothetical protein
MRINKTKETQAPFLLLAIQTCLPNWYMVLERLTKPRNAVQSNFYFTFVLAVELVDELEPGLGLASSEPSFVALLLDSAAGN